MSSESSEFLKNYQKTLFSDLDETGDHRPGIQRKCLAQMYNYSLETMDEESVGYLLEKNWHKYIDSLAKNKTFLQTDRIKKNLKDHNIQGPVHLETNLDHIDLKSLLKQSPCYKTESLTCTKSENAIKSDFREFLESFQNSKKPELPSEKPRTIVKSFAPRTCIRELKKFSRENSEESTNELKLNELPGTSRSFSRDEPPGFSKSNSFITARDELPGTSKPNPFMTARDELHIQNTKKFSSNSGHSLTYGGQKRKLGIRRNVNSKFVPPLLSNYDSSSEEATKSEEWNTEIDERLKNIDPKMVELIKNEIMDVGATIEWDDIAGLEFAKTVIQEAVVWPMLRPDIFTGLRRPPKGILLFGPPGTGKTLIGKCVASQSKSTFFSISASSLTSKWVGEGEKMVRALFAVARCHQPAVIFIDEIDSLLSQRSESEHESSRRIKTEFLVQLDGATTDNEERLLLIGATNRPQELDEAARRRFVKRLYIPLPEYQARLQLVSRLISKERNHLDSGDLSKVAQLSDGYSGADIRNLCSEAALGPIRSINMSMIEKIRPEDVRPLAMEDFQKAFQRVRSSVSSNDLEQYVTWDKTYGSGL